MNHPRHSFLWKKIYTIVGFTLLGSSVGATEITVLPAIIEGEIRSRQDYTRQLNLSEEFALLVRDLIRVNFYANPSVDRDLGNSASMAEGCSGSKVHYVIKDHYLFPKSERISVLTKTFNCRTGQETQKESILSGYLIASLEVHHRKNLIFLPQKEVSDSPGSGNPITSDIHFFLDANGSLSLEKEQIKQFVQSFRYQAQREIALYAVSDNQKYVIYSGNVDPIPFSKANELRELLGHWNQFRRMPGVNAHGKTVILLLTPQNTENTVAWTNALSEIRKTSNRILVVVPSHANHREWMQYQKIARSVEAEVLPIRNTQRVGFLDGKLGYASLESAYLYYTQEKPTQENWTRIAKERIPTDAPLSAYSMAKELEIFRNQKIIETSSIESNLNSLLQNAIQSAENPDRIYTAKFLVRSQGESMWIHLSNKERLVPNEKYILETSFVVDEQSATGVQNDWRRTKIHRATTTYPKLLQYKPSEVSEYLKKHKLKQLRCYMPIVVGEP